MKSKLESSDPAYQIKIMKPKSGRMPALIPAVSLVLFATSGANAQTSLYWNSPDTRLWSGNFWAPNADGSGTLTTPANNTTTNTAVFNASTQSGARQINLGANTLIAGIVQSQAGGTAIRTDGSNRGLNIGAGGITLDSGAGGLSFSQDTGAGRQVNVSLSASQSWTNNSSSNLTIFDLGSLNLNARTLTFAGSGSGNFVFGGDISGSGGSIIKNGTMNLTIGVNTSTGGITLNNGTLTLGSGTSLGAAAGAFTITGGTVAIGAATTRNTLNNNAQNWDGNFSVSGGNGGTWNTGTGVVTLSGSRTITVGTVAASTVTMNVQGVIGDGDSGYGITKEGDGFLVLSAANNYTGATTVSGGTLIVGDGTSGSLGSTAVTVESGATLGGSGTIGGATTIEGTHNAGNAGINSGVGSQTFSSTLNYSSGSIFEWDLNASDTSTGFDTVIATGGVTADSAAIFKVIFGLTASGDIMDSGNIFWNTPNETQTWTMANIFGSGFSGSFGSVETNIDVSSYGSFTINGTNLTWSAVPEPTTALAGLLLGAGLLRRRRA